MTWITDKHGTQWVEDEPRKQRKSPRAIRFADIKVGDQLMRTEETIQLMRTKETITRRYTTHYIVTDLWFDPVKGQRNRVAGEMVAVARIERDGSISDHKEPHTKRGLASQRFHYADRDYITERKALVESLKDGSVVGIGRGHAIRRRPKIPSTRL